MDIRLTFRATFSAATKRHAGDEAHLHGHTYAVTVTALKTLSNDWLIPKDLRQLVAELDRRQLEDMMPGASTDIDGIALWIMERLLMLHSSVVEVSVTEAGSDGDVTATATRPIRAPIRG
jgi:6-pyruvoyl-tetrahydropterin synthase